MTPKIKQFFIDNELVIKLWVDEEGHYYPSFHVHKQLIEVSREEGLKEEVKNIKK